MTTTPSAATTSPLAAPRPPERGGRRRRVAAGGSIIGAGALTLTGYLTCPREGGATQAEYIRSLTDHPASAMLSMVVLHLATCCWCPRPSCSPLART